ncbi:MAG: transketolase [Selenomonadaceae bacterium]|nr:transketolase [Selenomonadaceae bacterium]
MNDIDKVSVNAIRILGADMVQAANSGHPGIVLGAAPIAYELYAHHMRHNPKNPNWVDRDRFVLSAGHGSALLYSLLHLFGYGLTLDDLKLFRQLGSKTPGHPEYGVTAGVEATTGPLGAGLGMAVGMAMAEAHLAATFNKPDYNIVNHYTYALAGDGCMMEGISSEALSLAGTLGLGKLIILYDSNNISIEGNTDLAFTEDVAKRVESFGFQVLKVDDGNDLEAIGNAIETAKADLNRPSFIIVKTIIGYGSPKANSESSHGEPLGAENVKALKSTLGWHSDETAFDVPTEVYEHFEDLGKSLSMAEYDWNKLFADYCADYPEMKALWDRYHAPVDSAVLEDIFVKVDKSEATRASSGRILNLIKDRVPNMIGGSADLGGSNKSIMDSVPYFSKSDYNGRNIHFGVREAAMSAIINGLYLHGGLRSYAATFFVFSDYLKAQLRLSAIMKLPVIYIFTHDSIGVGEDGPTHEPIEQLAMLRSMPNVRVFRPADAAETAAAWYTALTSTDRPTVLVLTRQSVPQLAGSSREGALKGGYVISEAQRDDFDGILIATGSEVFIAIEAQAKLAEEGIDVRVVSMPCTELFEEQTDAYRESVLPKKVRARVAVEAASNYGWGSYVGLDGATVTMQSFGSSAPATVLFKHFGFTSEGVAHTFKQLKEQGI